MHSGSKSDAGSSSSSKSKSGGTGKSKSNDHDGTDDGSTTDFPKYLAAAKDPIPGQYIVTYKGTDKIMADSEMDDMSEKLCSSKNGKLMSTYHEVLQGFSAKLTKEAAMEISEMDMIEAVEEDSVVRANAVGSWGLDRIDQRGLPLDMTYSPTIDGSNRGQGVTAYIIDTGIQSNHNEWGAGSRYAGGMNFVPDGRDSEDCDGHGKSPASQISKPPINVDLPISAPISSFLSYFRNSRGRHRRRYDLRRGQQGQAVCDQGPGLYWVGLFC